jgi:ring-1,2-phenylacetyl-CoA epoxidase subunit PaaC
MNYSEKEIEALKDLLYRIADDQLIMGHRNSEWTGLGPTLEEDIAFSSMAQDKIGHAHVLYQLLYQLGEIDPDQNAFNRPAGQKGFKNSHLTEQPINDYAFSLMRHFFFDHAELIRFSLLAETSFTPLAQIARKLRGEIKYHVLHANTWIEQLGNATEESIARLQTAINETFPMALGIFEEGLDEETLAAAKIFKGEAFLKEEWMKEIQLVLVKTKLTLPLDAEAILGGRKGYHSNDLKPLLEEMTEVFAIDPSAEW